MLEKNLFLYNLAVVAIFKDEARYLREWLDYHLLAGVEHFYLYNNDSSDDFREVLAPYVERNLVTLTECPGRAMQYPACHDALEKFRFECRYMAFIDIDEFILPKSNRSIVEVVDEIFSGKENAAGLGINWQCFGSNGQITADYSRGVLERFTQRAPSDWSEENITGNAYTKTVDNPRLVHYRINPHFALYFDGKSAVNSDGEYIPPSCDSKPILADKIVVNHYFTKSKEEFTLKRGKGRGTGNIRELIAEDFYRYDHNEIFDNDILKYRAAREKIFSMESNGQRLSRVMNSLLHTLTKNFSAESFNGKLETFLTCRAVAENFQIKIGDRFAEELALDWIYRTLTNADPLTYDEIQMFMKALPEILARPFPLCKELKRLTQNGILPNLCEALKNGDPNNGLDDWKARFDFLYVEKFLRLMN